MSATEALSGFWDAILFLACIPVVVFIVEWVFESREHKV